ncbi:helix-turn-helix domain-containing protein [Mangrovibacter sp. SLW1]
MAMVSVSEAARLTGKSRTTLHRLIKTGELSTCKGDRNKKLIDTSELLRVFGQLTLVGNEQSGEQVVEQHVTGENGNSEQVVSQLKQEIEHLKMLVAEKDSHIGSLKQAMLLLEHKPVPASPWWKFWKR